MTLLAELKSLPDAAGFLFGRRDLRRPWSRSCPDRNVRRGGFNGHYSAT